MKTSLALLLALLLLAGGAPVRAQGVHVALTPSKTIVAPGDTFQVDLTVNLPGALFNAYDAVIGFNPAVLTFLPLSPTSLQQGSLMTGVCGNTFHVFSQAAGSLSINHSLLCRDTSLAGPGQLYKLRFRAIGPAGTVTHVTFLPGLQFYNGGVYVNTAYAREDTVMIGSSVGVDPRGSGAGGPRVSTAPNPARWGTVVRLESAVGGAQEVLVVSSAGRVVRRLQSGRFEAGGRQVRWDGRYDSGARAPAGSYVVTFRAAGEVARARVTLLR